MTEPETPARPDGNNIGPGSAGEQETNQPDGVEVIPPPPLPPGVFPAAGPGGFQPPEIAGPSRYGFDEKPSVIKIIAWFYVIGGAWAIFHSLVMAATFCCWIFWVLHLVAGVLGLVHGIKMLNQRMVPPSASVAWLFILSIMDGDILNLVLGIVILVLMNQPDVRRYYERY